MKYGQLSCIDFYSCYQQEYLSIDLFSYWTPVGERKGTMNLSLPTLAFGSFLGIGLLVFLDLCMGSGAPVVVCAQPDFFK